MYLPLHDGSQKKYSLRISVSKLGHLTVSIPLFAFAFCVIMTMFKDFDLANKTHCNVKNVFPSISASIGNYEPQITVWKSAIYIHAPLRFFIVYLRWKYYTNIIRKNCMHIVNLAVFLNFTENLALLGLTQWSSNLDYPKHEVCFKTFIGTSIFYMFFICTLVTKYRRKPFINDEYNTVRLKWRAFGVNVGSFACAAYFFLRHNRLCEDYVYSLFGLSEYIVVISNIAFHWTTVNDLKGQYVYINKWAVWTD